MKLNHEQQEVVDHLNGPIAVMALAGSGKTSAIVHRCVALVNSGVPQNRILAVTFSKAGADVMNERLQTLLNGQAKMRIGTFHSVGLQILTKDLWKGQQPPLKNGWYELEVKKLLAKYRKNKGEAPPHELAVKYIHTCKGKGVEPGSPGALEEARTFARKGMQRIPADVLAGIYTDAEWQRKEQKYITFDDMLFDTYLHLHADEAARIRWAERWDYVIQDEAQDQNTIQHKLGDMFARDHKNYCVVGDAAQCIFGWRGAVHTSIATFAETYGAKVIRLQENYRSGKEILELGEKVLHEFGLDKSAVLRCARGTDAQVRGFAFSTPQQEAEFVVDDVQALLQDNVQPHDIAILIRNGLQSLPFEALFSKRKIPFHLSIGTPFYRRRDVATLISYLRIITHCGETASDWEAALKRPTKYLSLGHIERITTQGARATANTTMVDIVSKARGTDYGYAWKYAIEWAHIIDSYKNPEKTLAANAGVTLSHLVDALGYEDFLLKDGEMGFDDESLGDQHVLLVHTLLSRAATFTVAEFLKDVSNTLQFAATQPKVKNKISLTTVHRAKGLEWPFVYVCGVDTGLFPHKGSTLTEEARVFYVAVTRAMNDLTVTGSGAETSAFLDLVKPFESLRSHGQTQDQVNGEIEGVKYFNEKGV